MNEALKNSKVADIAKWRQSQLHWDGKSELTKKEIPKSVALNWDKMTRIMRQLCLSEKKLRPGKLFLLDIGSGNGGFLKGIEAYIDIYLGLDPSDIMLSYANAKADKNRIFIRAVGEELPVRSGLVDIVVIKSVLDHCYDPAKVISESARVLKKDGLILISLSNRKAYYNRLWKAYLKLKKLKFRKISEVSEERFCGGAHQFHFSYHEVKSLMESGGFAIKSSFDLGYLAIPLSIQFLIPEPLFRRIIDVADALGTLIMPHGGGGFILAAHKSVKSVKSVKDHSKSPKLI